MVHSIGIKTTDLIRRLPRGDFLAGDINPPIPGSSFHGLCMSGYIKKARWAVSIKYKRRCQVWELTETGKEALDMLYKDKKAGNPNGKRKIPVSEYPIILKRREEGWTHYDIGKPYGASARSVATLIRKLKHGEYMERVMANEAEIRDNMEAVRKCLKENPKASARVIAIQCHMGNDQALRYKKKVLECLNG